MITLKTGAVGEGKSASCVGRALNHLRNGGVVATNFGLSDGWYKSVARFTFFDLFDKKARKKREYSLWSRWFRIGSVDSINALSLQLPDLVAGPQKKRVKLFNKLNRKGRPESLGLLILDEGHIFFNSRTWKENMPMINFLSQSRKKGWDVLIIAHHPEMIDKQIRSGLINLEESTRNLAKVKPLPLIPFRFSWLTFGKPFFLGIAKYSGAGGGSGMVHNRSLTLLTKDISSVYETMEEFDYLNVPDNFSRIGLAPAEQVLDRSRKKNPNLLKFLSDIQDQLFAD
ncbi:MAG: hypothetical protein PF549_02215 [Patescibacteria group bacterium]|jgi:hypothetical protein|nr:hypothetical protein [Patescibacteria group bacterium]